MLWLEKNLRNLVLGVMFVKGRDLSKFELNKLFSINNEIGLGIMELKENVIKWCSWINKSHVPSIP